ncbi:hypothetical protein C8F04DRAFT_1277227 [Mycena alexandri]|uniref:CxC2-like cysteine cluster KDZ transposase-associated domain-containing protein n=1 Tax=Mycena alexandri TaxID=1745969 RepID=A0AAD6S1U2_9AGAR|nr:hypothetical protein C8F04DRAFT_1277227 [Mycena alexandri]
MSQELKTIFFKASSLGTLVKQIFEVLVPLSALKIWIARSWYSGGCYVVGVAEVLLPAMEFWDEDMVVRRESSSPAQRRSNLYSPTSLSSLLAMPRKKGGREQIAESDAEDGDTPDVDLIPERHVHRGPDGLMRRDFVVVETLASPTKPKKTFVGLRSDLAVPEEFAPMAEDAWGEGEDEAPVYDLLPKEPRALRSSDNPLGEWVRKKKPQTYVDELIQLAGKGEYQVDEYCIVCGVAPGVYRCRECFTDDLYCKKCIVAGHQDSPLHVVEMWDEGKFAQTPLKTLGLRIQLGHGKPNNARLRQGRCANPQRAVDDDFVVIAENRIHEVGLDFCGCETAQPHDIQLLRARWYPSTGKHPRTAATFKVLKRFDLTTLESHCAVKEFYLTIARASDNTGTVPIRDRYDEFLRMTREWRHLLMLIRAGRGHDPAGVEATKAGECALLCPACPQPGKNLPPNWKDTPKSRRFLYALFLALDANFRMRRKKVSSEEKDPSLGDGWSFYCELAPYYSYLAKNWKQKQERSTCVAHDAVDKPDRESRGTASSGIATVDCARHNMKRPCSVGDLQLGERYINMDYIFFVGLAGSEISELFVSYDIACQWHKNIWERMKTFDQEVRFVRGKKFCVFLIPKFHLPAHIEACNILFSFHLTRYVGMTDGEAPERGWAMLNPLASSTAEMGPGNRRDTINHAFNDMNHKKNLGLGKAMLDKLVDCVPELIGASTELEELERSLRDLGAGATLTQWRAEVEAWEQDASSPNPFARKSERQTVVDVRREMAEEVEKAMQEAMDGVNRQQRGDGEGGDEDQEVVPSEDMHATEWIGMGLQLEELQRTLGFDVGKIGNHPTAEQQTNLTERGNKLRRKLLTWMDAQALFIPHVAVLRAEEDRARKRISATQVQPGVQVQHMALWLPSAIVDRVPCDEELYEYEFRLREAQAHEALDDVRQQLLLRTHLYKYKDRFARGVKANSRSQTKIEGVEERTRRSAERYRAAWRALKGLGRHLGREGWEKTLRALSAEDVRGMPRALFQDPERKKLLMKKGPAAREKAREAGAEAKARMSWIWRSPGVEEEEGGMSEALRIEWAKTRARFLRQSEQLDLLEEEMRRILQFLRWRAEWWDARAGQRPHAPEDEAEAVPGVAYAPKHPAYTEGNVAYAKRQAAILRTRAQQFEEMWVDAPDFISMGRTALGDDEADAEGEGDAEGGAFEEQMDVDDARGDEQPIPPRPLAQGEPRRS